MSLQVTIEKAAAILAAAGARSASPEALEADLDAAGIDLAEDGTFSVIDLAAAWVRLTGGGED